MPVPGSSRSEGGQWTSSSHTLALGSLGEQIPFRKKEAREFSQCRRQQVIYNAFVIRGHGEGPGAEFQEWHRSQLSLKEIQGFENPKGQ